MPHRRSALLQWAMTTAMILFAKFTALLPLAACRTLGRWLGWVAYLCVPRVSKVALNNLNLAYGDTLTQAEKRRIAVGAAQNACIVAAELSHMPQLTDKTIPKWVTVEGLEHIQPGRGTLVVAAHFGNWEWMASVINRLGYHVAEVVRPLDDPRLNDYIDAIRRSCDVKTIGKDGSGPEIFRLLKAGYIIGLLADQSMRESALPAMFFGQRCWATIGPAFIVTRAKAPMHLATMVRERSGRYILRLSPPIQAELSGDLRADLAAITQACQDAIEQAVRKNPEQWLWLHRRWKERPKLEAEWESKKAKESGVWSLESGGKKN